MRISEWPLVFFTVMIQMSVGFVVAFSFFYNLTFEKNVNVIPREISARLLFFICPVIITAMLISFFHLGSPKNTIYVLSNISNSWLSREILMTIIFSFLTCTVSLLIYKEIFSPQIRHLLSALCALAGLVLVFTMSRLYMLETVPAWDSYFTPVSFFITSLLLGTVSFLIGLTYLFQPGGRNIFLTPETASAARILICFCLVLSVTEIVIWLLHLKELSLGVAASKASFDNIIHGHAIISLAGILLSAAAIFLLLFLAFSAGRNFNASRLIYVSFCLIILLELTGRYLFYAMYARIGI